MIYDFTKEITFDIGLEIDIKNTQHFLEKKFSECKTEAELIVKLKKIIKNEVEFKKIVNELNLSIRELIHILIFAYPEMFNHYLIKFVRKKYLFKRKSIFERL